MEPLSGTDLVNVFEDDEPTWEEKLMARIDEAFNFVRHDMATATGGNLTHGELNKLAQDRLVSFVYKRYREKYQFKRKFN